MIRIYCLWVFYWNAFLNFKPEFKINILEKIPLNLSGLMNGIQKLHLLLEPLFIRWPLWPGTPHTQLSDNSLSFSIQFQINFELTNYQFSVLIIAWLSDINSICSMIACMHVWLEWMHVCVYTRPAPVSSIVFHPSVWNCME